MDDMVPITPNPKSKAHLWKYADALPHLQKASQLVPEEQAERRVLMLVNPNMSPPYTTDTIYGGLQIVNPGETAPAHRHIAFAARFIIDGEGFTAVEGKRMPLKRGDVIVTPTWHWHDHGNESKEPVIWLDMLNLPLFRYAPVNFAEDYIAPRYPSKLCDPCEWCIPWDVAESALESSDLPHAVYSYLQPNGQPLSTTLGIQAERLNAGAISESRDSSSYVYHCYEGHGRTEIESPRGEKSAFNWGPRDTFAVPAWSKLKHINVSETEKAYLVASRPQSLLRTQCSVPPVLNRAFHAGASLLGTKSQILKDVGEGITEVQIIQWYVEEGAHIEEWKPLCQYQSDKAVDDITSRYEGVIKKLHFEADDTVPTGRALCDIEVDDGKYPDDHPPPVSAPAEPAPTPNAVPATTAAESSHLEYQSSEEPTDIPKSKHASLATPAVRGLLKTHNINILDVNGTGKDGRVLKEDVLRFVETVGSAAALPSSSSPPSSTTPDTRQMEMVTDLTRIQAAMFKTMTKSLNTPHLLYADELNVGDITSIRKKLANDARDPKKVTSLPFIVKAVSLALNDFPLLNARVDTSDPNKPKLIMRAKHNIGIAMDTPNGLIVPNIKDVASRSIFDIASEISRLSALGKSGKLGPADLNGTTITVSNIGNIGGTYVAPVIVPTEVAILGVGRTRTIPIFDDEGRVTRGEMVNFSWSADHRVIDGATMARMGNRVKELIEAPELMLLNLR
ncbi:Lipoamide Acyltransferase [Penicillium macrosclerotiorum]|uniref:Lipoamide Acyltransferase n=1 Tax=Penicillium macrosclerotiorum TaxID=303699 RepID=UPI0025480B37|nr:Lipoamide Acyltransferase [Penicillium macrosclerotiorum]KAJ5679440.1 Lipoamide Acyltransferase [Penicillium macrosclerotiorum]